MGSNRPAGTNEGGALDEQQAPVAKAGQEVRALWQGGRFEEARLELVRATEASVYRFLRAMTRSNDAAADLFQDTYLRAFQALGSFRGDSQLSTWILSIARNLALNRIRRARLETRWTTTSEALPEVAAPPGAGGPSAEPKLTAALARLPALQREAVLLYYVEDLPIEEIVRLTGRPANTIKSDLHRARAALREAMAEPVLAPAPGSSQ